VDEPDGHPSGVPLWVVVLAVVWLVLAALLLLVVPRGLAKLSRPAPPEGTDPTAGPGSPPHRDLGP